ncbi:hypothetical protein N9F34_03885 [Alphaproteobacteria bacterium]|nr:hypothetical protein [Alphaproteobacteria bacterium]
MKPLMAMYEARFRPGFDQPNPGVGFAASVKPIRHNVAESLIRNLHKLTAFGYDRPVQRQRRT